MDELVSNEHFASLIVAAYDHWPRFAWKPIPHVEIDAFVASWTNQNGLQKRALVVVPTPSVIRMSASVRDETMCVINVSSKESTYPTSTQKTLGGTPVMTALNSTTASSASASASAASSVESNAIPTELPSVVSETEIFLADGDAVDALRELPIIRNTPMRQSVGPAAVRTPHGSRSTGQKRSRSPTTPKNDAKQECEDAVATASPVVRNASSSSPSTCIQLGATARSDTDFDSDTTDTTTPAQPLARLSKRPKRGISKAHNERHRVKTRPIFDERRVWFEGQIDLILKPSGSPYSLHVVMFKNAEDLMFQSGQDSAQATSVTTVLSGIKRRILLHVKSFLDCFVGLGSNYVRALNPVRGNLILRKGTASIASFITIEGMSEACRVCSVFQSADGAIELVQEYLLPLLRRWESGEDVLPGIEFNSSISDEQQLPLPSDSCFPAVAQARTSDATVAQVRGRKTQVRGRKIDVPLPTPPNLKVMVPSVYPSWADIQRACGMVSQFIREQNRASTMDVPQITINNDCADQMDNDSQPPPRPTLEPELPPLERA